MRPSFLGLAIGGILIGLAIILLLMKKQDFRLIGIILLLSIAVSVHSILHFGEEIVYGWNPLEGSPMIPATQLITRLNKE